MADAAEIKCGTHGTTGVAIVCCHITGSTERIVGFVENSDDPDDLQAWCDDCEQLFLQEGELTEAFRRFNSFRVVCDFCYASLKAKHCTELPDP